MALAPLNTNTVEALGSASDPSPASKGPRTSPSKMIRSRSMQSEGGAADFGLFDIDLDDLTWSPTSVVSPSVDLFQLDQDLLTVTTFCSASSVREDVVARRIARVLRRGLLPDGEDASEGHGASRALSCLRGQGFACDLGCSRRSKGDIFHCPRHEYVRVTR